MKIFLVGGGTGGPTAPLLAVAERIAEKEKTTKFYFVGTGRGPESKLLRAEKLDIKHLYIPAGKWRRYFSLKNFFDPFKVLLGFAKSIYLVYRYKPDVVFGVGSYVQVPVFWAAKLFRVPLIAHQQDLPVLLSTRLISTIADQITLAFKGTVKDFSQSSGLFKKVNRSKISWTGNPVRKVVLSGNRKSGVKKFGLNMEYPTILVMGGGLGAANMNKKIIEAAPELLKYVQMIHVTGEKDSGRGFEHEHYHPYKFLSDNIGDAFAVSDLVISRAGMSTISELSLLGKATILIPLPNSPQERNVQLLGLLRAAIGVKEEALNSELLVKLVRKILWTKELQEEMQSNIKKIMPNDSAEKLAGILIKAAQKNVTR